VEEPSRSCPNGELEGAAYPFRATIVSPFDFVRISTSVMTNLWPANVDTFCCLRRMVRLPGSNV
jgi:hypothetical protein